MNNFRAVANYYYVQRSNKITLSFCVCTSTYDKKMPYDTDPFSTDGLNILIPYKLLSYVADDQSEFRCFECAKN